MLSILNMGVLINFVMIGDLLQHRGKKSLSEQKSELPYPRREYHYEIESRNKMEEVGDNEED